MSTNRKYSTFTDNYDDSYKDVLSALSELDDNADIDYVKENYHYEHTYHPRHRRMIFQPLQHAARFLQCFVQKGAVALAIKKS